MKKKVLLIGYENSKIYHFLKENEFFSWIDGSEKITLDLIKNHNPEFIILHGCHSILTKDIVEFYKNKIINCHGGYLPWNRGAHPNVWSFIENTKSGGTVHYIDSSIDKGHIIERREINPEYSRTLKSVYWEIRDLLECIFIDNWEEIKNESVKTVDISSEKGTLHFRKDLTKVEHLLVDGWDTEINTLLTLLKQKNG